MKTILVATDFSPAALNATNYAAEMSLAINADLYLLHVFQTPGTCLQVPIPVLLDEMIQDVKHEMKKLKEDLMHKAAGKLNIKAEIRMDHFYAGLKAVCGRIKPYCLVMGSQGTTAAERFAFGGHTVYAMKHLEWPLIVVPPGFNFSAIKKILLACDYDNVLSTIPLEEIKLLVKDFSAELHVLNTCKDQPGNPNTELESGLLQEMLQPLNPEYHSVTSEYTDQAIMNFAEKNNIDLLIVLPKRHDLLDRLVHKSHSKQMVLYCHVPVMALHL